MCAGVVICPGWLSDSGVLGATVACDGSCRRKDVTTGVRGSVCTTYDCPAAASVEFSGVLGVRGVGASADVSRRIGPGVDGTRAEAAAGLRADSRWRDAGGKGDWARSGGKGDWERSEWRCWWSRSLLGSAAVLPWGLCGPCAALPSAAAASAAAAGTAVCAIVAAAVGSARRSTAAYRWAWGGWCQARWL